jgi:UbiD family decarboxylase
MPEDEGPFSEFQDYCATGTGRNPIVEDTCMTRRRDAIFKNLQNGSEMEGCVFHKLPMSATIYRRVPASDHEGRWCQARC